MLGECRNSTDRLRKETAQHSRNPKKHLGKATAKQILGKSWGRGGSCQESLRFFFFNSCVFTLFKTLFSVFFFTIVSNFNAVPYN